MSVLVDTNVLIDYLNDRPKAGHYLEGLSRMPAISVCTIMELYAGAFDRSEERQIDRMAQSLDVLAVSAQIARAAGQHMQHFARSHGLDDLDAIIAATAEHHGLELATLNVKHFPMFKRVKAAYTFWAT